MIYLRRVDKYSINFSLDLTGINDFLDSLQNVLSCGEANLEVVFDYSIISRKRSAKCLRSNMLIQKCESKDDSELSKTEGLIAWDFTDEDLDFAIEYFAEAKRCGYFFPAEFLRIKTPKTKESTPGGKTMLDWVYCVLVHNEI